MSVKQVMRDKNQINIILHEKNPLGTGLREATLVESSPLQRVDDYFQSFVGLSTIKETMKEIYASKLINDQRSEHGLKTEKQVLHMIFTGNPGTGKTTVARQMAKAFLQLDLLSKGHFIEAERADLVGEYIGQTAQKTRNLIQRALGGVLFIDEAYSLARGGEKDFGREAIDTIVKQMEDQRADLVIILAGYPNEMEDFLQLNPGLASRFPFIHHFEDYSIEQLLEIAQLITAERQYELTAKASWKLKDLLRQSKIRQDLHFANGRQVRNIIEKAIRMQALRLVNRQRPTYQDLLYIEEQDIQNASDFIF